MARGYSVPETAPESLLSSIPLTWWVVGVALLLILPFAVGIWMGMRQQVVVYRNYFDVMLVGGLYLIPAAITGLAITLGGGSDNGDGPNELGFAFIVLALVLDLLLLIFILVRTWLDNPNPLKMLLALYVKIPLGVLFFTQFRNIFGGQQPRSRRNSMFWTLMMAPLIHGLVRDKKGKLPGLPSRPR